MIAAPGSLHTYIQTHRQKDGIRGVLIDPTRTHLMIISAPILLTEECASGADSDSCEVVRGVLVASLPLSARGRVRCLLTSITFFSNTAVTVYKWKMSKDVYRDGVKISWSSAVC